MFRSLFLLSVLFVLGCDDDDNPDPGPTEPDTIDYYVRGQTLSELFSGEVVIYTFSGEERGRSLFFDQGVYYTEILGVDRADTPGPSLIQWTVGTYTEEADSVPINVNASDKLYSVYNTSVQSFLRANINYYTTLSAGLAMHYNNNVIDSPASNIVTANDHILAMVGFDPLFVNGVKPSQVEFSNVVSAPDKMLGLLHAGISQLTLDWSVAAGQSTRQRPYTTSDFISTAYDDIRSDGVLNGLGLGDVQLFVGDVPMNTDVYRHELAVAMIKFTENTNDMSGLTKEDVLSIATGVNDSTDDVYGGTVVVPIDEGGAEISNFMPSEGGTVSGDAMFSVDLYCTTGIDRVEFLIDEVHYTYASIPISAPLSMTATFPFYVPVFQPIGTSGIHTVKVETTCVGGAVTSQINNNVTFDNL